MRNLLECWGKIKAALADREIRLFLDFDGTLAPIRKHPDNAALSADRRRLLERLASLEDVTVAIVTGRSVRDIRRLVRIRNAVYIGNQDLSSSGRVPRFFGWGTPGLKRR